MVWNEILKKERQILVIDDSSFIQHIIEKIFRKYKISYLFFSNAEDAIHYLSSANKIPDLLLCDIILPGMNGIDFVKELTKNHEFDQIPIIFLSGEKNILALEQILDPRVLDYIQKPFEEDDFINRINLVFK